MRRELFLWEIKKLCAVPMIWIFIVLCIVFNCILIFSDRYYTQEVSYIAEVTKKIGGQMGASFDEALAAFPDTEYRNALISSTYGAADIYDGFKTSDIADYYISSFNMRGLSASLLELKFTKLQDSVDLLEETDASLSLAVNGLTQSIYGSLFWSLCRAIAAEGIIFAVLLALYANGSEELFHTASTVYSTKTGRGIQKNKLLASLIGSVTAYCIIAVASAGIFALAWSLGPIWDASISTQFYSVSDFGIATPCITWTAFSMRGYLAAVLLIGAALTVIFHMIGYICGFITGNMYYGFAAFLLFLAIEFTLLMLFGDTGNWLMYQLVSWTPIPMWLSMNMWFTGLGLATIVPYQECFTALIWLMLSGLLTLGLYHRFQRKDVTERAA